MIDMAGLTAVFGDEVTRKTKFGRQIHHKLNEAKNAERKAEAIRREKDSYNGFMLSAHGKLNKAVQDSVKQQ